MFKNISSIFCAKTSQNLPEDLIPLKPIQTPISDDKFLNNFLKHSSIISAEIYSYKIRTHSLQDYVVFLILFFVFNFYDRFIRFW